MFFKANVHPVHNSQQMNFISCQISKSISVEKELICDQVAVAKLTGNCFCQKSEIDAGLAFGCGPYVAHRDGHGFVAEEIDWLSSTLRDFFKQNLAGLLSTPLHVLR